MGLLLTVVRYVFDLVSLNERPTKVYIIRWGIGSQEVRCGVCSHHFLFLQRSLQAWSGPLDGLKAKSPRPLPVRSGGWLGPNWIVLHSSLQKWQLSRDVYMLGLVWNHGLSVQMLLDPLCIDSDPYPNFYQIQKRNMFHIQFFFSWIRDLDVGMIGCPLTSLRFIVEPDVGPILA